MYNIVGGVIRRGVRLGCDNIMPILGAVAAMTGLIVRIMPLPFVELLPERVFNFAYGNLGDLGVSLLGLSFAVRKPTDIKQLASLPWHNRVWAYFAGSFLSLLSLVIEASQYFGERLPEVIKDNFRYIIDFEGVFDPVDVAVFALPPILLILATEFYRVKNLRRT